MQLDFWEMDTDPGNGVVSVFSCEDSGCACRELVGPPMSGAALGKFRSQGGLMQVHYASASSERQEAFRATWGEMGEGKCGDRFRDAGEECDDGNSLAADGYSTPKS
jgi:cysteine-rich repeat protein